MSKNIKFDSLDILFNTPQGRQVLDTFFFTYGQTNDIIKAVDDAKKTATSNFSLLPLEIAGALDLLKVIVLLNPGLLASIQKLMLDIISQPKPKNK